MLAAELGRRAARDGGHVQVSVSGVIEFLLRAIGVAYAIGGVAIVWHARTLWAMTGMENVLERAALDLERTVQDLEDDPAPHEPGAAGADPPPLILMRMRTGWIIAGGVILAAAGAALAAWNDWARWLLLALLVHQALFISVCGAWARRRGDTDLAAATSSVRAAVVLTFVLIAVWFLGP